MMKKKAQGALEFLTTYGWAFLVILIMIGALGYFGILNPTRFLPERCNVNTEFSCEEFSLTRTGDTTLQVDLVLENALGQAIVVNGSTGMIELTSDVMDNDGFSNSADADEGDIGTAKCEIQGGSGGEATIGASENLVLSCEIDSSDIVVNLPNAGNKLKVGFNLNYVPQGKTLSKPISGEIFGALQSN